MKNFKKVFLALILIAVVPVFIACNQEKRDVVISIVSSNYQDGTVLGDGVYKEEDTITLIANARQGKTFVAWIKNNKIVSEEDTYTFKATLSGAGTYTAVFKGQSPTYLKAIATAISAKSLKADQSIDIQTIKLNFAVGDSTNNINLTTNEEVGFGVYENAQTSNILDFESEYLLRIRSSSGEQTYTLSANLVYTVEEQTITRTTQKSLTLVELEEKTDAQDTPYYQATLSVKDANIEGTIYIWFVSAGDEVFADNIII